MVLPITLPLNCPPVELDSNRAARGTGLSGDAPHCWLSTTAIARSGQPTDDSDPWVVDLTGEPIDEMVAGAVHAAVRRAVHPVVIRAGRYTIVKSPERAR